MCVILLLYFMREKEVNDTYLFSNYQKGFIKQYHGREVVNMFSALNQMANFEIEDQKMRAMFYF